MIGWLLIRLGRWGAPRGPGVLGLPLIAVSLVLFLSASNTLQVTSNRILAYYWRSSYDILVRPPGSRLPLEEKYNLVHANFLSGAVGGITRAQYEVIRSIPGVALAAPVAMVGYRTTTPLIVDMLYMAQPRYHPEQYFGRYRIERTQRLFDGIQEHIYMDTLAGEVRPDPNMWADFQLAYSFVFPIAPKETWILFLAGVDPKPEAELTGLDAAIKLGGSYLEDTAAISKLLSRVPERREYFSTGLQKGTVKAFPMLLNRSSAFVITRTVEIYREETNTRVWARTFRGRDPDLLPGHILQVISPGGATRLEYAPNPEPCFFHLPAPVQYREISPPAFLPPETIAIEAVPIGVHEKELIFRDSPEHMTPYCMQPEFNEMYLVPVGEFNSEELFYATPRILRNIPIGTTYPLSPQELEEHIRSTLNRLPFETYFLPPVTLKYREDGTPVHPPRTLRPTLTMQGYLTTPPTALTTLEGACFLLGREDCISAIRVVVDVEGLDPQAQARIQQVAEEIVRRTGLEVDIMVGTSPRRVFVHIPGIGWAEELWVQKGVTTRISRGFRRADLLLSGAVFLVAWLFLLISQMLTVLGRTRELGILRAVGWRTRTVFRLVLGTALMQGLAAGGLGLGLTLLAVKVLRMDVPMERSGLALLLGLLLYLSGGVYPAWRAAHLPPVTTMQLGEVSGRGLALGPLSLWGYGLRHLLRRPLRTVGVLAVLAISTALATLLLAVRFAMQGELYGILLGEYVYTRIRGFHYGMVGIGLMLSGLSIAEVMQVGVAERRREIGLLKATGWHNGAVFQAIVREAILVGGPGGALGALGGALVFRTLYRVLSPLWLPIGLAGIGLAIGISTLAALPPAAQAAQIPPAEAMRGE